MKRFFLVNLVAGSVLLILLRVLFIASPEISHENGLLENIQATLLGTEILILWIGNAWWLEREDAWVGLFLTATLLTMLLRELDLERLPVPSLLAILGSGIGRNLLLGLLWVSVLAILAKRKARLPGWIRQGIASAWGRGLLLGGGTYLLAFAFDQKIVPLAKPERLFWEEALETIAVLWIGMGVLLWALADKIRKRNIQPILPK